MNRATEGSHCDLRALAASAAAAQQQQQQPRLQVRTRWREAQGREVFFFPSSFSTSKGPERRPRGESELQPFVVAEQVPNCSKRRISPLPFPSLVPLLPLTPIPLLPRQQSRINVTDASERRAGNSEQGVRLPAHPEFGRRRRRRQRKRQRRQRKRQRDDLFLFFGRRHQRRRPGRQSRRRRWRRRRRGRFGLLFGGLGALHGLPRARAAGGGGTAVGAGRSLVRRCRARAEEQCRRCRICSASLFLSERTFLFFFVQQQQQPDRLRAAPFRDLQRQGARDRGSLHGPRRLFLFFLSIVDIIGRSRRSEGWPPGRCRPGRLRRTSDPGLPGHRLGRPSLGHGPLHGP